MNAENWYDSTVDSLSECRNALVKHPVNYEINTVEKLRLFMQRHVFAVWDFMSLLKSLQRKLTVVDVPWFPAINGEQARLINEIVLSEESDEDGRGGYCSHFELYCRAMDDCGAATDSIENFQSQWREDRSIEKALRAGNAPSAVREFVGSTFQTIQNADLISLASVFAFGRENLLSGVFKEIVGELNFQNDGMFGSFLYYLNRHVEVDGDQHGPMTANLIRSLGGNDPSNWNQIRDSAAEALNSRRLLWDSILKEFRQVDRRTGATS